MKSKMKSQIFIYFIIVYCLNKVASYHQYLDYRNGAYPQRPDWSNNQEYPQNQNLIYSHHQPAVHYGSLQQVANYAQSPTEAKYVQHQTAKFPEQKQEPIYVQLQEASEQQRQQRIEESSGKIQSEAIYAEQPTAPLPRTYQEAPRSYSDSPDRSYGVNPQIWQQAPLPNPVYRPHSYSQVSRQWSIPNTPLSQPTAYWQSGAYKNVPQQNINYGGSPYDEKPIYNTPVQAQSQAEATSISAKKNRELLASNPKVKEYLATHDKRFLLIHPNGMTEHVDVLDESILGNSQRFKSSDIFIEKDVSEKNKEKAHKRLVHNQIGSPTQISDSHNNNRNLNEPFKNDFVQPSNFPKEINPSTKLVIEYPTQKYYNPRLGQIHTYKENDDIGSSIPPVDKPMANNNHRNNPVVELPKQPNENSVNNQNIASAQSSIRNYENPSELQKYKTNIIEMVKNSEDNEYLSPQYETNNRKYYAPNYSYPVQANSESNSNSSSLKTVGEMNHHQNTSDSSPSNDESEYHNSSGGSYLDTSSEAISYAKSYEVPDESNNTTITLPHYFQSASNNSDTINNTVSPTFETPKNSDYDDMSFNIYKQKQATLQESNDDTGSVAGDVDSATDIKNIKVTNGYMENQDKLNYENTNPSDGKDYDIVDETKPRTSDVQSTNYENVTDNDNLHLSKNSDRYLSSTTADEISTVETGSSYCEHCATDDEQTKIEENLPAQPEIIGLTGETNPDDTIGDREVLVGYFTGLKNVSKPFELPENIWDELSSKSDLEDVYVIDLKFLNPKIERISKVVTQNGTTVEEIEETIWEHKDDTLPRQRRFTKIITYPGPEHDLPQKKTTDKNEHEEAVVPKCEP